MVLLAVTKGEAGLPLGMLAELGTGEARLGGGVGAAPLVDARDCALVGRMVTCVTDVLGLRGGGREVGGRGQRGPSTAFSMVQHRDEADCERESIFALTRASWTPEGQV